jgi:hypothetical protein
MLTMEARKLKMEPWRPVGGFILVVADSHHFDEEQDTDPYWSAKPDPDPYSSEKQDPDPH